MSVKCARRQVARNSRYANTSPQVGTLKFMVKFALEAPASNPVPPRAPSTVRITRVANPDNFYPSLAKREKVAGEAVVEVAVDPSGKVVNVGVTDVLPADPRYEFGSAAIRVAKASGYANSASEVSTIKFKVKFTPRR